jgi:hypothetical protein
MFCREFREVLLSAFALLNSDAFQTGECMATVCGQCGEDILPGTLMMQLAFGFYYKGFETPTYCFSAACEWHYGC